jgi:hypothetical protein
MTSCTTIIARIAAATPFIAALLLAADFAHAVTPMI